MIEQKWLNRHEKGWVIHFNNEAIVKLVFLYTSQPIHHFSVEYLTSIAQAEKGLKQLCDHSREEDSTTFLLNEKYNEKIEDLDFLLAWNSDEKTVSIRDLSEPKLAKEPLGQSKEGLLHKLRPSSRVKALRSNQKGNSAKYPSAF